VTAIVFYFQVHQPYRLNPFTEADVGTGKPPFDTDVNRRIAKQVAKRCYLPMNEIVKRQIEKLDGRFRCAFSLSGTAIQQMRDWAPAALDSFVALAETGAVEFLAETSHHSLAFETCPEEFEAQVRDHAALIEDLFGKRPTTFRNTELCIDANIAARVEKLGFDVLLGEGADRLLGWRSSHFVYQPRGCERLKLLLRNYVFSDDIAFRFSNREWPHHPLFADTFASWLHAVPQQAQFLGLFMDYETFGEHQWAETGILEFMEHLPAYVLEDERFSFQTPAELAAASEPVAFLDLPDVVSWADAERDLSAWLGNAQQQEAHAALYALAPAVRAAAAAGHPEVLTEWRRLTTSDHVYYMCAKADSDGEVHAHFSPYPGPEEAFLRFSSVLDDLQARLAGFASPAARSGGQSPSSGPVEASAGTPGTQTPSKQTPRKQGANRKRTPRKRNARQSGPVKKAKAKRTKPRD
jgi:alpha-amylase